MESTRSSPRRLFRRLLQAIGLLLVAVSAWVLVKSERRFIHVDERNTADLIAVVDDLTQWPNAAQTIGRQNFYAVANSSTTEQPQAPGSEGPTAQLAAEPTSGSKSPVAQLTRYHPDFGSYQISYTWKVRTGAGDACSSKTSIEGDTIRFVGATRTRPELLKQPLFDQAIPPMPKGIPPMPKGKELCFDFEVPLENLLRLDANAPSFRALLIAKIGGAPPSGGSARATGSARVAKEAGKAASTSGAASDIPGDGAKLNVEARIGNGFDTVSTIGSQGDIDLKAHERWPLLPALLGSTASSEKIIGPHDPGDIQHDLREYRVYVRHFQLQPPHPPDENQAVGGGDRYLALAFVDREQLLAGTPRVPLDWIIVLALGLGLALALAPALRFVLQGPTDAISRFDLFAVVFGICAATAIATVAVGLGVATATNRAEAKERVAAVAARMANDISAEIEALVGARNSDRIVMASGTSCSMPLRGLCDARPEPGKTLYESAAELATSGKFLQPAAIRPADTKSDTDAGASPAPKSGKRAPPSADEGRIGGSSSSGDGPKQSKENSAGDKNTPGLTPLVKSTYVPADDTIDFDRPESVFVADQRGLQLSQLVTRRDTAGGDAFVTGRPYFEQARRGHVIRAAYAKTFSLDGKPYDAGSFTVGRVRAYPDGLHKTILTIPSPPDAKSATGFSVLTFAWVSKPLLAPILPGDLSFMVVDLSAPDLNVVAHTVPARAQVEQLSATLGRPGVSTLRSLALAESPACGANGKPQSADAAVRFAAHYDGHVQQFAAVHVPCSPWAVVVGIDREVLDATAAEYSVWALAAGSSLIIGILILVAVLLAVRRLIPRTWPVRKHLDWRASDLWPDPRKTLTYERRWRWLAAVAGAGFTALAIIACFESREDWQFETSWAALVVAFLVLAATLVVLTRCTAELSCYERLCRRCEVAYTACLVGTLICVAVIPTTALLIDARASVDAMRERAYAATEARRALAQRDALVAVTRTYHPALRDGGVTADLVQSRWTRLSLADHRERERKVEPAANLTLGLRQLIAGAPTTTVNPAPILTPSPPVDATVPGHEKLAIALLVLMLGLLLGWFIMRLLRALFGFGVPLAAVDYPRAPVPDMSAAPAAAWSGYRSLTMIVSPGETLRNNLVSTATRIIDLFTPPHWVVPSERMLIINLELVLSDQERRLKTLGLLEGLTSSLTGAQKIIVLTPLSPLERLLHGYDRASNALYLLSPEEQAAAQRRFSEQREAIRWSRLFEDFDTFYERDRPAVGKTTSDLSSDPITKKELTPEQQAVAQRVLDELNALPDSVVDTGLPNTLLHNQQAGVGMPGGGNAEDRKERYAFDLALGPEPVVPADGTPKQTRNEQLRAAGPRAVVEYFASLFIEHYQLAWSAASQGERLVLYNLAHRRVLNLGSTYQLTPLVRRGLVVLDPVPRLMNRSFGRFICYAETSTTVREWRNRAPKGSWKYVEGPAMLLIGGGLLLFIILAAQSGVSLAAYAPVLVGAGPTILRALGIPTRPT